MDNIAKKISTVFSLGFIRFAPGTFGSLAGLVLYFLTALIVVKFFPNQLISGSAITETLLFINTIFFILSLFFVKIYIKDDVDKDPSEVVIDEVVGQYFSICLIVGLLPYFMSDLAYEGKSLKMSEDVIVTLCFIGSFVLFRFFDIVKPWPVSYFDKNIKGALGIMLDDVVAAALSVVVFYFLIYFFMSRL